jgi:Zn-dependent M28 family amino/carboxypeptidase
MMLFTGWLRRDGATDLLARTGLELDSLKLKAREPTFSAFAIEHATVSASADVRASEFTSHNVLARIKGSSRPDEYVIYGAHWDANGRNGPDARGDEIRNGAVDNATGTAEVLELARAFAKGPRPARTMVFAAWTAEEKGLLGAGLPPTDLSGQDSGGDQSRPARGLRQHTTSTDRRRPARS